MNHRDQIIGFVRRFPGRNDDELSAALQIRPRQAVNQICRNLEANGVIVRRLGSTGKIRNFPVEITVGVVVEPKVLPDIGELPSITDTTSEWFWEGNVTNAIGAWLEGEGWTILSKADTRSKQRGIDLHVTSKGGDMFIEVKGYPSQSYRDPRRAGESKPTSPTLQAQHWYSHAFLKGVRLQGSHPLYQVALGLPDFPTYRRLFQETSHALSRLKIAVLFLDESGQVETLGL